MNVVRENQEDLTTLFKVKVEPSDYTEAVDKALRTYRRKANVPGFRPGMVPMGIINKMYRKGVLAEESYRLASKGCFDYIEKENLTTVGDVIPSERQQALDFDTQTEFEFVFEAGLVPEIQIELSPKDKLTRYNIEIEEKMREGYRNNFLNRFGKLTDVEEVDREEALDVTLVQGDTQIESAYVGLIGMSDEERAPFVGKKVGDSLEVDVNQLYKTASQRASVLGVKESDLEGLNPIYTLTINKIRRFSPPALTSEFFGEAFPDGSVTDESSFAAYIEGRISEDLARETDYLFKADMRKFLLKKASLVMPEAFLKNWLYTINEGKFSHEEIEKDFDKFLDMMRWSVIQKHYMKALSLEIQPEEALAEAKNRALGQFAYYGISNPDEQTLESYAKNILSNKEESHKIYEALIENRVIEALRPQITVTEKNLSAEDFGKLAQEAQ